MDRKINNACMIKLYIHIRTFKIVFKKQIQCTAQICRICKSTQYRQYIIIYTLIILPGIYVYFACRSVHRIKSAYFLVEYNQCFRGVNGIKRFYKLHKIRRIFFSEFVPQLLNFRFDKMLQIIIAKNAD